MNLDEIQQSILPKAMPPGAGTPGNHPYPHDKRRQSPDDLPDFFRANLPRRGSKNEAESIRTRRDGGQRIKKIGDSANLYRSHDWPPSNSRRALLGSFRPAKDSPTKNPSTPNADKASKSRRLLIPLSLITGYFLGISG